jgi:predicted SprT family Zn-dependent metalloprotease
VCLPIFFAIFESSIPKTHLFMPRAIFKYTKTVLKKVSFNAELFYKELEKAVGKLLPHELTELELWLIEFTQNKPELQSYVLVANDYK